jgi:hypothetical protein
MTRGAVEAYHALFFDVRDRLEVPGYITHQVIGPKLHVGLTEADINIILKVYAYHGGVPILEQYLDYYRHPPVVPDQLDELDPAALQDLRCKLLIKAAILARVTPTGDLDGLRKLALLEEAIEVISASHIDEGGAREALVLAFRGLEDLVRPGTRCPEPAVGPEAAPEAEAAPPETDGPWPLSGRDAEQVAPHASVV